MNIDNSPLSANSGPYGRRPHLLTRQIRESLLNRQTAGFDWLYIETVGLPDEYAQFDESVPEDVVAEWAVACGYTSLSDADQSAQRPQALLLCRPSKQPPEIKKQGVNRFLLRQALILSRCIKSTYDPDKTLIITARRLQRKWDLYTIGGFYAPEY